MRLLEKIKKCIACNGYERKLRDELEDRFGVKKIYSPTEITLAIRSAGLSTEYRQIAFEMFLSDKQIKAFEANSKKHPTTRLPTIEVR